MKTTAVAIGLAAALFALVTTNAQAHHRHNKVDVGVSLHFPHASVRLNNRQHHHAHHGHSRLYPRYRGHYRQHPSRRGNSHQAQHHHCKYHAPNPRRCMARIHNTGHGHHH